MTHSFNRMTDSNPVSGVTPRDNQLRYALVLLTIAILKLCLREKAKNNLQFDCFKMLLLIL